MNHTEEVMVPQKVTIVKCDMCEKRIPSKGLGSNLVSMFTSGGNQIVFDCCDECIALLKSQFKHPGTTS